ncbi:MAG: crotonase/enoyl-CoA hydratase family protein, partial [Hyphomicrobiaceae bacterium]
NEVASQTDAFQGVLHSRLWHSALEEIQFGRVPVVAVLHGAVVGGGLELAASTHIRVAERSAYYALPEGQRGIFLGGGGSMRLPRLVGLARVQDMMLTGRTLGAEDGQAAGISQYLVEDGEGMAKGMELARKMAANAPLTNFAVMHALPRIAESDPAAGLFTESLMAAIAETSPEAKQRLIDFLEKRAAKIKPGD